MCGMKKLAASSVLRLLRAQSHVQNRFGSELGSVHGLSLNELLLLMQLDQSRGGRLKRVELADRLDLSQSSVTRMVAPMEKVGWVSRADDLRDGRVGYVVLTEAGRRLVREAARTLQHQASTLFGDHWTDDEVATLNRLLGRLIVNLPGQLGA